MDNKKEKTLWWIFLPICIGLGTGVGALMGNIGVGITCGVGVGTILNLCMYYGLVRPHEHP